MEIVENKTFNGETIVIDEKFFVKCHLTNCTLLYSGGEMMAKDSRFDNCPLQFSGAANRTAALLQNFGLLKSGVIPPGVAAMQPTGKPQ